MSLGPVVKIEAEATFMPIRVQCPGCKTALAVKDHLAGKRVRCPKCQTPIAVPGEGAPAPKAAAPLPVAKPAKPLQSTRPAPKPAPTLADREAEAAAALHGDSPPTNGNGAHGNGNGHAPPADAPIKFTCDFCEAAVEFPAEMAGKRAQCTECRQIIKVPVPKVDRPKDWRTVEKHGPSAAAVNQPAKIENAWGTEKKATVSQKALLEAGVIAKPTKPSIGLAGWIERGVKATALALVVGGVSYGIWTLGKEAGEREEIGKLEEHCKATWPGIIQGEFHIGLGHLALKQPKQADTARLHFMKAWQKAPPASDSRDKLDRDGFLIHLASAQVFLGGTEDEIRFRDRFDWNQEVFEEIDRTVKKIDNPEARGQAVRELAYALTLKQQPKIALSLVRSVGAATPHARAVEIAILWSDSGKQDDAKKIAAYPEPGKGTSDLVARCGYAEGLARLDKIDDAMKLALLPGETSHKVQALLAVAAGQSLDPKVDKSENVKNACAEAKKLLDANPKANVPAWVLVQHVRYTARCDSIDAARALALKLPAACKRRAQLEIALATLERVPPPDTAVAIIHELDKEGPSRALAWFALFQSKAKANQSFRFEPEDAEEEALQPFFNAAEKFRLAHGN